MGVFHFDSEEHYGLLYVGWEKESGNEFSLSFNLISVVSLKIGWSYRHIK